MTHIARWLRAWPIRLTAIGLSILYALWADNLKGMWYGAVHPSQVHYLNQLFRPSLHIALGCFVGGSGLLLGSLSTHTLSKEIRLIGAYLVVTATVLVFTTSFTLPLLGSTTRTTTHNGSTYLLEGTYGASGNAFYRSFVCDPWQIACHPLSDDIIALGTTTPPTMSYDAARQRLIIQHQNTILATIPTSP